MSITTLLRLMVRFQHTMFEVDDEGGRYTMIDFRDARDRCILSLNFHPHDETIWVCWQDVNMDLNNF